MAAFVSEVEVGVRADYHFTAITTNFAQFDLSIYMNNDKDQSALEFSHPGLVQHYSGYFRIFHQCLVVVWLDLAGLYQRRSELSEWQIALSLGFTEIAHFVRTKSGSIPHQYCNCLLTPITNTTTQPNLSGSSVARLKLLSFRERFDIEIWGEDMDGMRWFNYGRLSLRWY